MKLMFERVDMGKVYRKLSQMEKKCKETGYRLAKIHLQSQSGLKNEKLEYTTPRHFFKKYWAELNRAELLVFGGVLCQ